MAGMFDDLPGQTAAPAIPAGGMFDDLPGPQKAAAPAPTSGDVPVSTTAERFFTNLPQYPGVLASRFADLARRMTSGEALPQSGNVPGQAPGGQAGDIGSVLNASLLGMPTVPGGLPMKAMPFKGPTEAALEANKTARYNDPAITGLQLKPEAGQDLANIIRTDLKGTKLDRKNGGAFYDIADGLEKPRFSDNLGIADFEAARQDAQTAPATATANDKRGSAVVRKAIDNYLGNIPQSHVLSGDATAANDALLKARDDFSAMKRSQDVTAALARAENRNAGAHSAGNLENLTKQQLRPILDVKTGVSKVPGFEDYTPEEIDALRRTMFPNPAVKQIGNMGRRLGSGGGHGQTFMGATLGVGAHEMGADPVTSLALGLGSMVAGKGLGALAGKLTQRRGESLGNLLRSRSALGNEMNAAYPQVSPMLWPQFMRPFIGFPNSSQ